MPIIQNRIQTVYTGSSAVHQATRDLEAYERKNGRLLAGQVRGTKIMDLATDTVKKYTVTIDQASKSTHALTNAAHRQRIGFVDLMKMMVMFGIGLSIINTAMSAPSFLLQGAQDAIEFRHRMNLANTVLDVSAEKLQTLSYRVRIIAADFALLPSEAADAMYDIGQSIAAIDINKLDKGEASLILLSRAATLAKMTNTTAALATEGLIRTMVGLHIGINRVDEAAALMFKTIDIGIIKGEDFNRNIGDITGALSSLIANMDVEKQKSFSQSMLAMWSAISQVMPAPEASTSVKTFMNSLMGGSQEARNLTQEIQRLFGVDVSLGAFLEKGPQEYFHTLHNLIKQDGPLIDYIAGRSEHFADAQGNVSKSTQVLATFLEAMFGNVRALNGVFAIMGDNLKTYDSFVQLMTESTETYNRVSSQFRDDEKVQIQRAKSMWVNYRMLLVDNLIPSMTGGFKLLADSMKTVMMRRDLKQLGFFGAIGDLLNEINKRLGSWWYGGGQAEWMGFWHNAGLSTMDALQAVFTGSTGKSIMAKMGKSAADQFTKGFITQLKETDWNGLLGSGLVQMISLSFLLGWKKAVLLMAGKEVAKSYFGEPAPGERKNLGQSIVGLGEGILNVVGILALIKMLSKIPGVSTLSKGITGLLSGFLGLFHKTPPSNYTYQQGRNPLGQFTPKQYIPQTPGAPSRFDQLLGIGKKVLGWGAGIIGSIVTSGLFLGLLRVVAVGVIGVLLGAGAYMGIGRLFGYKNNWGWAQEELNKPGSFGKSPRTESQQNITIGKVEVNVGNSKDSSKVKDEVVKGITEALRKVYPSVVSYNPMIP